jgi:hypothetical protein
MHVPPPHSSNVAVQSVQASPPVPQAMSCVPTAQTSLAQQPTQFEGAHAGMHAPPAIAFTSLQSSPSGQGVHAPPAAPHALLD